ncbi:hypothetical protein [Cellulophaga omnivescoria]|uniref:hypothetical protein n=1 Tax=Cellulophaga omnivescoria TaxID=1888890 RepID=UPI000986D91B|nr:hypothetical protein [Cellulophaga omnivescoria]
MKSENTSVFYQSKKEKATLLLVLTVLLLVFIVLSVLTITMFLSFFDGKTITDKKSIFFLIFMSIILLSPVVISIYLLLMIYNQFKQNKVICTINNNNIYVSDYATWIRKPTTILANTKIPLSDIKSVETKKVLFKTIIKLNFTLDKYNMLKGKINSSLNRISAKDKEFFKSRIEAILNYNQNI